MFIRSTSPHILTTRRLKATILAVIYLIIFITPLASLTLNQTNTAHAANGECSGDCTICGCSLENRVSQTCCCAKKKRLQQDQKNSADDDGGSDCCKKKQSADTAVISKCACPCGSSKHDVISNASDSELIPCFFSDDIDSRLFVTCFTDFPRNVTSRHVEPPDPPPRQA